jgi:ribose-phosphate pyrophosphokinase
VTVDPHLHRHPSLESLFSIPAQHISAMPLVGKWIASHVSEPVLIGPDSESAQWVGPVAHALNAPLLVLSKARRGDREVEVSVPDPGALAGRTPVLVDDIVSSGHTLLESLAALDRAGARPAVCIAVHGLFAENADERIRHAGVARLVSANTVTHVTNAIDISPAILPVLQRQLEAMRTREPREWPAGCVTAASSSF